MANTTNAALAAMSFSEIAKQAQLNSESCLTFNKVNMEIRNAETTGNVGFRVTTDQGQVITFWSSNVDQVVEELDNNGNCRVLPGTGISKDGGLIPADRVSTGGFWK